MRNRTSLAVSRFATSRQFLFAAIFALSLCVTLPAHATSISSISISGPVVGGSMDMANVTVTISRDAGDTRDYYVSLNCSNVTCDETGPFFPGANGTITHVLHAYSNSVVGTPTVATITGTLNGQVTASMMVNPFQITLSLPSVLHAGESSTAKLSLNAVPGGQNVCLSSAPTGFVSFDASCYYISLKNWQGFYVYASSNVTQDTVVTVTATIANVSPTQQQIEVLGSSDGDLGCSGCSGGTGQSGGSPINFTNGNTWITHRDYSIPGLGGGLSLTRTWNSLWTNDTPVEQVGMFGDSWRSTYEERLQTMNGGNVRYWRPDGSSWTFDFDSVNNIYHQVAPQTEHATLTYNSGTGQSTITFVNGSSRVFGAGGYLTLLTDRNGNQTTVTRDSNGRISQVTDAAGRTLQFNYPNSSSRLVSSAQDSVGVFATYTYDSSSRLTQVSYPDGSAISCTYNTNTSLITSVTDANGKVLESHTYEGYGTRRGLTSVLANGVEQLTVSYPQTGSTHVVDSAGNASDYSYTEQGGTHVGTGVSGNGCSSCNFGLPTAVTYDRQGNVLSSTDLRGVTTQYTYDALSNVTSVSRPVDGTHTQTYSYTYNSFGEVLTATDPLGNVTTNTYDVHGNLLTTTTPSPDGTTAGSKTTFTYDTKGELLTITDPLNHVTTLTYTPTGLLSTITDAQNHVTTYGYDARGNRTSITDATNHQTLFTYDSRNRLTKITYPDNTTTQYAYDTRGRRISVTDQNGKVTTYAYDDSDRLTSVTDAQTPTHGVTQYAYDNENNLTSITDALNRTTSFAYDKFRRVTQTTFPSTLVEKYTYDGDNNLLTKTDRNGNTITYVYDNLNRMTSKQYPGSGGTVSYTYDLASQLTQVSDSTGTYGFIYDNMGRLTGTSTQYSFLSGQTFTNSYSYDAASNRTGFTAPDGSTNTYAYDSLNRLSTLTNSLTGQFGFGYDALSRRSSLTRPNNVSTSYNYDSLSHLLSILHQANGTTIDGATYTYDNVGNRMSKLNQLNGVTENYTYDLIYQLTQVQQIVNGRPTTSESYTFDAVGNRLSSLNVASYFYNSSNELTSSADGYSYTFDANGNTLTKSNASGTTQYAWDFLDRLSTVTLPNGGGVVSFKYDPFGRRIQKSSPSGITNYLYDEARAVDEVDASGNVLARYAQGLTIDEPLSMQRSGASYFYSADGIGSITSLESTSGAVASTYTYNSFGSPVSTGSLNNPYRYTARDYDGETGEYFFRARYLDPSTGRFNREDPVHLWTRAPEEINSYVYVRNRPTSFVDPLGQETGETMVQLWGHPQNMNVTGSLNLYGHWCGPGGWGTITSELDGFCEEHDKCYDAAGATAADNILPQWMHHTPDATQCKMTQCDKTLCKHLLTYTPTTTYEQVFVPAAEQFFHCIPKYPRWKYKHVPASFFGTW